MSTRACVTLVILSPPGRAKDLSVRRVTHVPVLHVGLSTSWVSLWFCHSQLFYSAYSKKGDFYQTVETKLRKDWKGKPEGMGLVILPK